MDKLQALALGSALGGVAGVFYAWQFSYFSPDDFQPLLTFGVVGLIYLSLCLPLSTLSQYVERRLHVGGTTQLGL